MEEFPNQPEDLHEKDAQAHHKHLKAYDRIALSVLAGAILIAASIVYNAGVVSKSLSALEIKSSDVSAGAAGGQAAAPTGPVTIKDRAQQPVLGKSDAKVTIVEFADFQCPFCQRYFNDTFPQIKAKYIDTGKVKYIFRHFPLGIHVNAEISAVAAECANQQGKFWEYHDLLFKNGQADGTNLASVDLKKYADSLGLNKGALGFGKNKFNQCLDTKATLQTVKDDVAEGTKAGVTGTPSFFINGQKITGAQPFAKFQEVIDAALR